MELTEGQIRELNQIFKSDSRFLADHNLMDYSLMLVIEQLEVPIKTTSKEEERVCYTSINSASNESLEKNYQQTSREHYDKFERSFKDIVND